MSLEEDKRIYDALALPNEALANGGVEILRAGIIEDELFVSARRAFKDHAQWGDVLAIIARRIATLQSAEDTEFTEAEILGDIEEAFLAALGAPVVAPSRKAKGRKAAKAKSKAKSAKAKSAKAKPASTKPRMAGGTASAKSRTRKAAPAKRARR